MGATERKPCVPRSAQGPAWFHNEIWMSGELTRTSKEERECFMQETGNLGEWWIHVQTPTLKICSPMKVFKGGILWGGSQSLLSLLSATVFRLSSDWLLMTQQGGAPGILGSARGYHLLPGVGAPHFLLKNSKVFC